MEEHKRVCSYPQWAKLIVGCYQFAAKEAERNEVTENDKEVAREAYEGLYIKQ